MNSEKKAGSAPEFCPHLFQKIYKTGRINDAAK